MEFEMEKYSFKKGILYFLMLANQKMLFFFRKYDMMIS
ncbi:hypothetical protein SMSK597_1580 [Streptococcus mitis SK597]|uniref:Uncharacterized protein n=1 Tax=Streptococcus mitis SK597 TaxID=585204 RepID=E1LUD5_STRMT|nr:hypothetical protein SMSK597_1580 [Streptococcus mitis SK597]